MYSKPSLTEIQRLVGPCTEEQLRFIDSYVYGDLGLYMPVAGPCFYSLSPAHTHPSYLIVYSFKGESEGWVDGVEIPQLKSGDILFMAPDIVHNENEGSEMPKYIAMTIHPDLFEPIAEEYGIVIEVLRKTVTTAKAHKQFLPLCWQFISEANSLFKQNKSLLEALTIQMCHAIIRSVFKDNQQKEHTEWRTEIGQSIAFIHSHLHEKIDLKDIANASNMSVPNFSRVFKKELQQTPIEYLSEQRLYKAQSMLLSGEFSMQDIADSCGFSSISYFSTAFRKKFLLSPEKYRQSLSAEKESM